MPVLSHVSPPGRPSTLGVVDRGRSFSFLSINKYVDVFNKMGIVSF